MRDVTHIASHLWIPSPTLGPYIPQTNTGRTSRGYTSVTSSKQQSTIYTQLWIIQITLEFQSHYSADGARIRGLYIRFVICAAMTERFNGWCMRGSRGVGMMVCKRFSNEAFWAFGRHRKKDEFIWSDRRAQSLMDWAERSMRRWSSQVYLGNCVFLRLAMWNGDLNGLSAISMKCAVYLGVNFFGLVCCHIIVLIVGLNCWFLIEYFHNFTPIRHSSASIWCIVSKSIYSILFRHSLNTMELKWKLGGQVQRRHKCL